MTTPSTPKGRLQRFILGALNPKKGKTRRELEDEYAAHLGTPSKAPGTYQALTQLASNGLITAVKAPPTGKRGRAPMLYTLTEQGAEARKAVRKQDRAA